MSDWADEAAAKIIFDLATRYPTDGFGRMPCAVIADALRSRIAALEAELSAEKAKVAKLRKAMVEIRDRQARNILPWTHEQAADEYARMLDADRMTARRIHEETA